MELKKVKELIRLFHQVSYQDLFGALVLNEKIDYLDEVEDITQSDIDYTERLYEYFIESDKYSGLINQLEDFFEIAAEIAELRIAQRFFRNNRE